MTIILAIPVEKIPITIMQGLIAVGVRSDSDENKKDISWIDIKKAHLQYYKKTFFGDVACDYEILNVFYKEINNLLAYLYISNEPDTCKFKEEIDKEALKAPVHSHLFDLKENISCLFSNLKSINMGENFKKFLMKNNITLSIHPFVSIENSRIAFNVTPDGEQINVLGLKRKCRALTKYDIKDFNLSINTTIDTKRLIEIKIDAVPYHKGVMRRGDPLKINLKAIYQNKEGFRYEETIAEDLSITIL